MAAVGKGHELSPRLLRSLLGCERKKSERSAEIRWGADTHGTKRRQERAGFRIARAGGLPKEAYAARRVGLTAFAHQEVGRLSHHVAGASHTLS